MDKNFLIQLDKLLSGMVLETREFGRSGVRSIWLESYQLTKIALILKNDSKLALDWLENLSVVEFEKSFVFSYFLFSRNFFHSLVLRASAVIPSDSSLSISFPSVSKVWEMAFPMECEISELYGIDFLIDGVVLTPDFSLLPSGLTGFPMRKSYSSCVRVP